MAEKYFYLQAKQEGNKKMISSSFKDFLRYLLFILASCTIFPNVAFSECNDCEVPCYIEPSSRYAQPPCKQIKPLVISHHHYHHYRRHTRRVKPLFKIILGQSELWGAPLNNHLSIDMNFLSINLLVPIKRGNWMFGYSMELLEMKIETWLGRLEDGDYWLNTQKWGKFAFFSGNEFVRFQAGFRIARTVTWGLPDSEKALWSSVKLTEKEREKHKTNELESEASMTMLPMAEISFHIGTIALRLATELLSWDLRSYRGDAELSFHGKDIAFSVGSRYIQEGARLAIPTLATWTMRTWEMRAGLQFDILKLINSEDKTMWGPILFKVGIRYRNMMNNHLKDTTGRTLFEETKGGSWSISAGLIIGLGRS